MDPSPVSPSDQVRRSLGTALRPFLALIFVTAFFAVADGLQENGGRFTTVRNAQNVIVQSATVAVAALGMTLIIISAGIDLSAGTGMGLCACVLAWLLKHDYSPTVAVLLGIATGGLAGLVNGLLISLLRIVPFIVTLGTMTIFLGLGKVISENRTIRPAPDQIPAWMGQFLNPRIDAAWMVVPPGIWLLLLLALVVMIGLRFTVFGRHVSAMGSNESAARLSGINVTATRVAVYTLAGLLVGIAGLFQFARLPSANPTAGIGKELRVIASVVIGGGSLSGGRGSILGTLTGALIMQVISNGCTALRLPDPIKDIIIGIIIIVAVAVDQYRKRQ